MPFLLMPVQLQVKLNLFLIVEEIKSVEVA